MSKFKLIIALAFSMLFAAQAFAACEAEANWSNICPGTTFPDGVKWGEQITSSDASGCYFYNDSYYIQSGTSFKINGKDYNNTMAYGPGTTCGGNCWGDKNTSPFDGGYYIYVTSQNWSYGGTSANRPACALPPAASINNLAPKVDDVLTASITNVSGESYNWFAEGNSVQNSASNTYTVTASDVGKKITVTITYSGGETSSEATAVVVKKNGPPAPAAPTSFDVKPNSITLTPNSTYEFRLGSDGAWQASNVFGGLQHTTDYDFYQRIAESPEAYSSGASVAATIRTAAPAVTDLQGNAVISKTNPTISDVLTATLENGNNDNSTFTYIWYVSGVQVGVEVSYTVQVADAGKTIKVEISGGGKNGSVVSDPTGPVQKFPFSSSVPTALTQADILAIETFSITLVASSLYDYGYGTGGTITWMDPGVNTITGLSRDTDYDIYRRYAETADTYVSNESPGLTVKTANAGIYEPAAGYAYFISMNNDKFTARKGSYSGGTILGTQDQTTFQTVIDYIKADANGNNVSIQFGDGNGNLNIKQSTITFSNDGGSNWGDITLLGKINADGNSARTVLTIGDGISVQNNISYFNFQNPGNSNHVTIKKEGSGLVVFSGAAFSASANTGSPLVINDGGTIIVKDGTYSIDINNRYTSFIDNISGKIVLSGTTSITGSNLNNTTHALIPLKSGTLEILGGTTISVNNTADRSAIRASAGTSIILGGNPSIAGRITAEAGIVSVLTEGVNAFAPVAGRTYAIDFPIVPDVGSIAVTDGAAFFPGIFTFNNISGRTVKPSVQKDLILVNTTTAPPFTGGTTTIDNTSPRIGDVLTASYSGSTPDGVYKYQWTVGGTAVAAPAGTGKTYTVQQADLDKVITVAITTNWETGSITSAPTAAVQKKANTATPIAPELSSRTYNSVTLVAVANYEYSKDNATWQSSNVFNGLSSSTIYNFYQRIAATGDTEASAESTLQVTTDSPPANALNGTATIDYVGELRVGTVLTAMLDADNSTTLEYEWIAGGTQVQKSTSDTYTVTFADLNKQIMVVITGSGKDGEASSDPTTTVNKAILTGTATISGTTQVNNTLTATLEGGNGSGVISYEWKSGSAVLGTGATYTLKDGDVGRQITVTIATADQEGTLTSEPTSKIRDASGNTSIAYFLTSASGGDGSSVFKAEKSGSTVATQDMDLLINTIRADAGGADVIINFGTGTNLSLSKKFTFENTANEIWGEITLKGGLVLRCDAITIGSGVSVVSSSLNMVQGDWGTNFTPFTNAGTLTITGGSIPARNNSSTDISIVNTGSIILGGNPTIVGRINTPVNAVSVLTDGENTFAPTSGKTYQLDITNKSHSAKAVGDGAGYVPNFTLVNASGYTLMSGGINILLRNGTTALTCDDGFTFNSSISVCEGTFEGTATITSNGDLNPPRVGDVLTAELVDGPASATLKYAWSTGATTETYTLTAADVGSQISVIISAIGYGGSDESAQTNVVAKMLNSLTPGNPQLETKDHESITLVAIAEYEYSMDDGTTWQSSNVFSGLDPNTSYTFIQRIAETNGVEASKNSSQLSVTTEKTPISGVVEITGYTDGIPRMGDKLTAALTGGNNDGNLSYEWKADGTTIGSNASYTLTETEVNKTITVEITSDSESGFKTGTIAAVVQYAVLDGKIAITSNNDINTPRVGDMLTAGFTGDNNTGTLSYQWKADGSTIGSNASYTLTETEVNKTITVVITSDKQTGSVESAATTTVKHAELTGTATITSNNPPRVGDMLTVALSGDNNTGNLSYQWKAGGSAIGNNASTYTLTEAEVDKTITVEITSDKQTGTLSSGATNAVEHAVFVGIATINSNDPPRVGDMLTVALSGDNNTGTLSYQWKAGGSNIAGATASTYTLTYSELNATITVEITSDKQTGSVASAATAQVQRKLLIGIATIDNTAPRIGDVLTAAFTGNNDGTLSYVWSVNSATGSTYTVVEADFEKQIGVTISSDREEGEKTSNLTAAVQKKVGPSAPAAPTLASKTHNSITLTATSNYEYSKDGSTWQVNNEFTGLEPNTEYKFYQRIAETNDTEASAASDPFTQTTDKITLAGTATISNTAPRIGDVLIATLESGNNATHAVLSYEWSEGSNVLQYGTGSTYTVVEADLGKQISVVISSDNEDGTIASSQTSAVLKKAAPTTAMPTVASKTHNSITLTAIAGYEYSKDGTNWQASNVFTGLDPDTDYTFYQYMPGTSDTEESAVSGPLTVKTEKIPLTGTAEIAGYTGAPRIDDELTATFSGSGTLSYEWKADGIAVGNSATYTVALADLGKQITVAISSSNGSGEIVSDPTAAVQKKVAPDAPAAPAVATKTHNSVTLTATAGYEYSKDGATWQAGSVFSGLIPETGYTFYQRIAETSDTEASTASSGTAVTTAKESTPILPQIAGGNWIIQTRNGINLQAKAATVVEIFNASGTLVSRQNYTSGEHTVSLTHLPKGMYMIKATVGSEKKTLRVPVM